MKTALEEHIEWMEDTLSIAEEQAPTLVNCLKLCISDAKLRLYKEENPSGIKELEVAAANLADPNIDKTDNWIAGAKWMLEKLQDFDTWKEWKHKLERHE